MAHYAFINSETETPKIASSKGPTRTGTAAVSVTKYPNSVNGTEKTEGNTDKFHTTTGGKEIKPKKYDLKQLEQTVQVLCAENNIDPILLRKCLNEVMGVTPEKFAQATEEQKAEALAFVKRSIIRAKNFGAKHNKNINILKAVVLDAKFAHDAIVKGTFSEMKDIDEKAKEYGVDNVQQEVLEADWDKLSKKEKMLIVRKARAQMLELKKTKEAEIAKLPKEEQEAARAKLAQEIETFSDNIFNAILMKVDSENAMHALTIGGADKVGDYAEKLLETRSDDAERMVVANKMDYNFYEEEILKELHEQGEQINAEALSKYNENVVAWKDTNASYVYQNDYKKARERFNKGEAPDYYSEEVFKSTAEGIGVGAQINHVMSAEEKATFTALWEKDAKDFGDKDVIESVNQKVETYKQEHPEEAKEIEKSQKIFNRITGKDKSEPVKTFNVKERITFGKYENTGKNVNLQEPEQEHASRPSSENTNNNISNKKLVQMLANGKITIEEALQKSANSSKKKIITDICKNQAAKNNYAQDVKSFIQQETDVIFLAFLAVQCNMVNEVIENYRGNEREKLYKNIKNIASFAERQKIDNKDETKRNAAV